MADIRGRSISERLRCKAVDPVAGNFHFGDQLSCCCVGHAFPPPPAGPAVSLVPALDETPHPHCAGRDGGAGAAAAGTVDHVPGLRRRADLGRSNVPVVRSAGRSFRWGRGDDKQTASRGGCGRKP